jgi:hypothetical protein
MITGIAARRTDPRGVDDRARVRSWLLVGFVAAEVVAILAISLLAGPDPFWTPVQVWLVGAYGLGGAFLVRRQPANTIGWILWVIGAIYGLTSFASGWVIANATLAVRLPGSVPAAWFENWGLDIVFAMAIGFLPLLFPDGRPPTPRWRPLVRLFVLVTVLVPLGDMLRPGPIRVSVASVMNPTGLVGPVEDFLSAFGAVVPLVILPIVIAAMVVRYRRGTWIERQQLKWFAAAAGVTGIGLTSVTTLADLLGPLTLLPTLVTLGLMPIAIGIAVTRYRLYDIDRIVGRTVGWAVITILLVAVVGGLVIGLQALLAGVTQGQTLAVAASTLAAFALFQPVRRRVQGTVDRRFDRTRYDAQRTVETFAERLRGEVDLKEIQHEMVDTVRAAVRPVHEGVWLRSVTE